MGGIALSSVSGRQIRRLRATGQAEINAFS